MKKSEILCMMVDLLAREHQTRSDLARDKAERRRMAEQRQHALVSAVIPLLPAILERLAPARYTRVEPVGLGLDLASALIALNRSLTPGQTAAIADLFTAEQQMMMVDATRLASEILGADPFSAAGAASDAADASAGGNKEGELDAERMRDVARRAAESMGWAGQGRDGGSKAKPE